MSDLVAVEVNCETGEVTERPLTADELEARELEAARFEEARLQREAEKAAAEVALAAARQELLDLGLSEAAADAIMSQRA